MTSRPALCSPEALYEFVEVNHDFLLVVDDQEQIVHASLPLQKVVGRQRIELIDRPLEVVVTPDSLGTIQQGLAQERKGNTAVVIFSPSSSPKVRVPLKTHSVGTGDARVCLLYGTQADALKGFEKSEQEDRIRQLSCLYAIADWTDRSTVVDEFFQKLPPILARGVQFPDQAVVS